MQGHMGTAVAQNMSLRVDPERIQQVAQWQLVHCHYTLSQFENPGWHGEVR